MIFRHPRLISAGALSLALFFSASAQIREYKAYKVVQKKKAVMAPFKTTSLSDPIVKMLNENLTTEIMKTGFYDMENRYPDFNLDAALGMPADNLDLYTLSEVSEVKYLLVPTIEKLDRVGFRLSCDLYDVRRMERLHSYYRECDCAFEDVVFLILPDVATSLAKAKFDLDSLCPDGMVKFSKASFTMGSDIKYDNNPAVTARVENYCLDRYEFPNTVGREPSAEVTWSEALAGCQKAGKRLCSEFEWEFACRSKFNFIYPYGNTYTADKCNTEGRSPAKIGSFIHCQGEAAVYDMSGNVNEWTGSSWDANIQNKVIRGGGWSAGEKDAKCTVRVSNKPAIRAKTIGFRCCKSLKS